MSDIAVSVVCATYNHEKYIRQALDSIVCQVTNFQFEILVGEDCSTDKTREILKEYEVKYPKLFKIFYRDKNLGATLNEYELFMNAKGKYIAALELDDYWTDELKLQKQFDFLEAHQEYIGVSHDFSIVNSRGDEIDDADNKRIKDYLMKRFTLDDFLKEGFVFQTATHFYRNIFLDKGDYSIIYKADRLIRDKTVLSLLLDRGDFFIMSDTMSAYRRFFDADAKNGRNVTNANLSLDLFTKAHHVEMLNSYFNERIDYSLQWADIIYSYQKALLKRWTGFSVKDYFYMYKHANKKTRQLVRKEFFGSLVRFFKR